MPNAFQERIEKLLHSLLDPAVAQADDERLREAIHDLNSVGFDPWGLDPETLRRALRVVRVLYDHYFRVEVSGVENIPSGRALVIANHGGQLPLDGLLVGSSIFFERQPPRIARAMIERWVPSLPWVSTFFQRCGQVVGDQRNAKDLLNADHCVVVFPEGVKGSGKTIFDRYKLQQFGSGFMRLALETKTPIVPAAVIGCEEIFPSLYDWKWLAKKIKAPYIPITPLFPLLGPLGVLPLPTKVTIRFAAPIHVQGDPDASEAEVQQMVEKVKQTIQGEIDLGLKLRGNRIFTGAAK